MCRIRDVVYGLLNIGRRVYESGMSWQKKKNSYFLSFSPPVVSAPLDQLKPVASPAAPPGVICFLLTCSPSPLQTKTSSHSSPSVSTLPWRSGREQMWRKRRRRGRRRKDLNPERSRPMWWPLRWEVPGSLMRNILTGFWDFLTLQWVLGVIKVLSAVWDPPRYRLVSQIP